MSQVFTEELISQWGKMHGLSPELTTEQVKELFNSMISANNQLTRVQKEVDEMFERCGLGKHTVGQPLIVPNKLKGYAPGQLVIFDEPVVRAGIRTSHMYGTAKVYQRNMDMYDDMIDDINKQPIKRFDVRI